MIAVFPIHLHSDERGRMIWEFRDVFMATRKSEVTWFCFDVIVRSRTDVTFVVFDMRDTTHGGKGKELYRYDAVVSSKLTLRFIEAHIYALAEARRSAELQAAEHAIIDGYANEIRTELELSA